MIIQGNNLVINGTTVDSTKLTNHDLITVTSDSNIGLGTTTPTMPWSNHKGIHIYTKQGASDIRLTREMNGSVDADYVIRADELDNKFVIRNQLSGINPLIINGGGSIDTPNQPGCMIACQSSDIYWTAGNIIQYGTNSGGNSQKLWDTTNSYNMPQSRYYAPVSGKYYLSFTCNGVYTSSTRMRAYPRINGSMIGNSLHARGCSSVTGDLDQRTFAGIISLNASDYVDVYIGEGTADTFGANYFCIMKVM